MLATRRFEIVGVRVSAAATTAEISCSICSVTALSCPIRGMTLRMMPVSRNSTWLINGAFETSTLWAWRVVIGTASPTCRVAGWFSTTTSEGDERIFTSVKPSRAESTMSGPA